VKYAPSDGYQTTYLSKSIKKNNTPDWFVTSTELQAWQEQILVYKSNYGQMQPHFRTDH
jgi:hypothetical protein